MTLFNGWARLSTNPHGEMVGRPLEGFFQAGTRLVDHYRLLVNQRPLIRTYSIQGSASQWSGIFLVPGTLEQGRVPEKTIPRGSAEVSILRQIGSTWTDTIRLRNHSHYLQSLELEMEIGCPLGDVEFDEEMKTESLVREPKIEPTLEWKSGWKEGFPTLVYRREFGKRTHAPHRELQRLLEKDAPQEGQTILRGLVIDFQSEVSPLLKIEKEMQCGAISKLKMKVSLKPRTHYEFSVLFKPIIDGQLFDPVTPLPVRISPLPRRDSDRPWAHTIIRSGNSTLNQIVGQAQVDLELLKLSPKGPEISEPSQWEGFSAGIPRYIGIFGRDTLTTAWQAALFSPEYLEPAIQLMGSLRGVRFDPWRDEEPDRILHERRLNPKAAVGESNREVYYGDVASTPFWLVTLAAAYNWTGDRDLLKRHAETFESCLRWVERRLSEGNGFIYYAPSLPEFHGCNRNHAWKDSDDAIVDAKGLVCPTPLAAVEIQGYCYLGLLSAAEVMIALGRFQRARSLLKKARDLKKRFNEKFWLEDQQFFALALDRDAKPIGSIASNIGHCLGTGLIDRNKLEPVVRKLISPEMYSGWGIRTLSTDNPAYDPFSYHRGSVWPVENSTIAAGFAVCGFMDEAVNLIGSQFALATLFPCLRLPEVVSGHERSPEYPAPGLYPQANLIQAWSVSAVSLYIQILLGLRPLAPLHTLFVKPILPDWIPWIEIHDLKVGKATISLRFWRDRNGCSQWKVLKRQGHLRVIEQPPELSPETTVSRRVADLGKSIGGRKLWIGVASLFVGLSLFGSKKAH